MVNFPMQIPNCGSHSPTLLDLFLSSSDASICSTMLLVVLSLHWEILIMLLSQFPLTFQLIHNRMPRAYDYSCADWEGLCDHLREVPWGGGGGGYL